jgi:hypothetical protein
MASPPLIFGILRQPIRMASSTVCCEKLDLVATTVALSRGATTHRRCHLG